MAGNINNGTKKISEHEKPLNPTVLMAYSRYYHGESSEFNTLGGHVQRAVEREARFQVDSYLKSKTYGPLLNKEAANTLFDAHCEYYTSRGIAQEGRNPQGKYNMFTVLLERDSEANIRHQLGNDNYENKTARHAATIDYDAAKKQNRENGFDVQDNISQMIKGQNIR